MIFLTALTTDMHAHSKRSIGYTCTINDGNKNKEMICFHRQILYC